MENTMTATQTLVNIYANRVQETLQEAYNFRPEGERPIVEVEVGRKYYKLVADMRGQRSVHSFVDCVTGDVFMPAGWAKPAKGARYNVTTGMGTLLASVDPYGSYLYKTLFKK
jgi:hypothetical protein